MVRPVPIVRIDFGGGHIATRTLHGNIASYVCAADGQVYDILPGMYTPAVYAAALAQLGALAVGLSQAAGQRQTRLRTYHQQCLVGLRNPQPRNVRGAARVADQPARRDVGKSVMERRVERMVVAVPANVGANANRRPARLADLADWEPLAADTWINETERRRLIHEKLARHQLLRPQQLKKWLYKDVLHVDLDDPYLGLGDALFGDDVFAEEDC